MKELVAKIVNTRGYENLREILGKELGGLLYELVEKADECSSPNELAKQKLEEVKRETKEDYFNPAYNEFQNGRKFQAEKTVFQIEKTIKEL